MNDPTVCREPLELFCSVPTWDRTVAWEGNRVEVLLNGERAYPAMMTAIASARERVSMCIYQFDEDSIGSQFAELLVDAMHRGCEVRVILDSWGAMKSQPSIRDLLRRAGINVKMFHPPSKIWKYNQRYHRKLLLVDGEVGFTGGMNIRDRHLVETFGGNPMRDTVFEIKGSVLEPLEALFLSDWVYCGGQADFKRTEIDYQRFGAEAVALLGGGPPFRRVGLRHSLTLSIAQSTERVVVVTPFFFPDRSLLDALASAALRGVGVDIVLPTGDYEFLRWCAADFLVRLMGCGCSVYLSPPPYDHSKILLIDQAVFIGTVNLDFRSLYLNWEVAMECRGGSLVFEVERLLREQLAASSRVRLEDLREQLPWSLVRKLLISTVGKLF